MQEQTKSVSFSKSRSDFTSGGVRCAADLYLPDSKGSPPVIIMGHGFAAERCFGLPAYAEYFVGQGMAVFLFDYRSFGDSDGEPRQLVNPRHHLDDWQAAINHARSLQSVDSTRTALWGSSFSGGHVIVTAATSPGITAIVSQVPFVDALGSIREIGVGKILSYTYQGLRDISRELTGRSPYYTKIVGKPGESAFFTQPGAYDEYMSIIPKKSSWENKIPARLFLLPPYRPIKYAPKVSCPALMVIAEKDSLISAASQEEMAALLPKGRIIRYPIGHFDIYKGKDFERTVQSQAAFLRRYLLE